MMDKYNIGENIRARRKLLKKNQGEIAGRIGVSKSQMSKWENESTYPSVSNFLNLSYALNIRPEALIEGRINEDLVENKEQKDKRQRTLIIVLCVLVGILCIRLVIDVYFKFTYFNGDGTYKRQILYDNFLEDGTREIRQLVKSGDGMVWIDVITYQSGGEIIDGSVLEIIFTDEYVETDYISGINQDANTYTVHVFYNEDNMTKTTSVEVKAVK